MPTDLLRRPSGGTASRPALPEGLARQSTDAPVAGATDRAGHRACHRTHPVLIVAW